MFYNIKSNTIGNFSFLTSLIVKICNKKEAKLERYARASLYVGVSDGHYIFMPPST